MANVTGFALPTEQQPYVLASGKAPQTGPRAGVKAVATRGWRGRRDRCDRSPLNLMRVEVNTSHESRGRAVLGMEDVPRGYGRMVGGRGWLLWQSPCCSHGITVAGLSSDAGGHGETTDGTGRPSVVGRLGGYMFPFVVVRMVRFLVYTCARASGVNKHQ